MKVVWFAVAVLVAFVATRLAGLPGGYEWLIVLVVFFGVVALLASAGMALVRRGRRLKDGQRSKDEE